MAEQAAGLDKKFALSELVLLEKLKTAVVSKNAAAVKQAVGSLGAFENNLYTAHQTLLSHITVLCQAAPAEEKRLKSLEVQLQQKANEVFGVITTHGGQLFTLVNADKLNFPELTSAILRAEKSISEWIALTNDLIATVNVTRAEYRKVLAAPQEKLIDLLKGKGWYAKYTQDKRRDLWNRWVSVSTQRVLKTADLKNADLRDFSFSGFTFKGKTNLSNANLDGANLIGANLSGASLREANLYCADLAGAKKLTKKQLQQAYKVDNAKNVPQCT